MLAALPYSSSSPKKRGGKKIPERAVVGDYFLKFSTRNIGSTKADAEVKGFGARGGFFASTKITIGVNYPLGLYYICFLQSVFHSCPSRCFPVCKIWVINRSIFVYRNNSGRNIPVADLKPSAPGAKDLLFLRSEQPSRVFITSRSAGRVASPSPEFNTDEGGGWD